MAAPPATPAAAAASAPADHPAQSSCASRKLRNPSLKSLYFSLLDSDAAYEQLQLAKHFVIAYTPYVAPVLFFFLFFTYTWLRGWSHLQLLGFLIKLSPFLPTIYLLLRRFKGPPCYLLDFSCFKSLDEYKLSTELCEYVTKASGKYAPKTMLFQLKVLLRSGLGDETYGPAFLYEGDGTPSFAAARGEMDHVMFGALDELLAKTHLDPACIDVLIVNVSLFYPSPSLAANLVNHYKMREDVKSFNISGMGCASGMVALDLAKDLLRVHKDTNVVVVGSENITLNWYYGNDKSMLLPNCLFRVGAYALLLSNKAKDRQRAKFELVQSVRTTTAAQDKSYNVIVNREDDEGILGISLSSNLLDVASQALALSMAKLVPYNMPFLELLKVAAKAAQRAMKMDVKKYTPDFRKAFTHFCIHPGGRAVIDGIGKSLRLTEYDMEPAKMALHRFGNTSSGGLWYALAYCEAKKRLKKGDTVWQVAFGSGFKCNSVVWRALRDVRCVNGGNPWLDCIHRYPVEIPKTITPEHRYYGMLKRAEIEVEQGNNWKPSVQMHTS